MRFKLLPHVQSCHSILPSPTVRKILNGSFLLCLQAPLCPSLSPSDLVAVRVARATIHEPENFSQDDHTRLANWLITECGIEWPLDVWGYDPWAFIQIATDVVNFFSVWWSPGVHINEVPLYTVL